VRPHALGHFREAVAGQVDQPLRAVQPEEIDELRAARSLAGARQILAAGDGVQRAGLAGVGTAGERDLGALVGRKLVRLPGTADEVGLEAGRGR
jgi:hypothetical protein